MKFKHVIIFFCITWGLIFETPYYAKAQSFKDNPLNSFVGHFKSREVLEKKCSADPMPLECVTAGVHLGYCEVAFLKTPPLMVVGTGYDADKEQNAPKNRNYIIGSTSGASDKQDYILPKRSVVQVMGDLAEDLEERGEFNNPNTLVPVRVLSIPPVNEAALEPSNRALKNVSKYSDPDAKKKKAASVTSSPSAGQDGYVRAIDLEKVSKQKDYIFVVKNNTYLYETLSKSFPDTQFALQLHQQNGKYKVNLCCDKPASESERLCRHFPIFKVLNVKTGQALKDANNQDLEAKAQCEGCLLSSLVPMQLDFMKPLGGLLSSLKTDSALKHLASIDKLNFVDSRGFVQIPTTSIAGDETGRLGPFGSYHYTTESGESDLYMKPEAACGLNQVLKTWNEKYCKDGRAECRVEFGDASHSYYSGKDGNWGGHSDHGNGDCIDIRPMTSSGVDSAGKPQGKKFASSSFRRDDFRNLLKLFAQLGPDACFMSDSKLVNEFSSSSNCSYRGDHDDHLHICLPKYNDKNKTVLNEKLIKGCQEGVK